MKRKPLPRILLSLLGAALILCAAGSLALGVFGERATAAVTDIRREGGERADGRPGRYTYIINYTFKLPEGEEIHGFTRKIGDAVYLKADGTGRMPVRYFAFAPFLSSPEEDTRLSMGQPVLVGAGILLIVLINRKPGRT